MAFNPFEAFRKRSKAIFAVVGIVVMFTFVLSAGTGGKTDFFGQLGSIFSGSRQGATAAEIYGDSITAGQLEELRRQRLAANSFMMLATNAGYINVARDISRDLQDGKKYSNDTKSAIDRFIGLKLQVADAKDGEKQQQAFTEYNNYLQQMFSGPPAQLMQKARQSAKPDSDDAKVLETVQTIQFHDLFGSRGGFFNTVPGTSVKDLLDFEMLLKKADKLGLDFTPNAVKKLVNSELPALLTVKDNGLIESTLKRSGQFPNFSSDWLIKAITNEYKVRAAYVSVAGNSPSGNRMFSKGESAVMSSTPGALTPHEFFQFYQDQCKEVNYTVFEVPTESFVAKVTEEPTAKDRNALFAKYRAVEADDAKETPGFKIPRKVNIDFVKLDPNAPRIAAGVKPITAASFFLSGLAVGGNHVSLMTQLTHQHMAETLPLASALEDRRAGDKGMIMPGEAYLFRPRDTSIYRPEPIVSMLGSLSGFPDVATVFGAQMLATRNIELQHLKVMTPTVLQVWLAPFNATSASVFGWPAFSYALNPKSLNDELYLPEIRKSFKKRQLQALFRKDSDEFGNKMFEAARDMFGPKPDKTKAEAAKLAANKFATEWATARGLTITGNKEPVTKTTILTDPALKPLVDAAKTEGGPTDSDGNNALVRKFFSQMEQQFPGMPPQMQTIAFEAQFFPNANLFGDDLEKPQLMVWMSNEVNPVAYTTLEDANKNTNGNMTKMVDAAWKFDKAKALAEAEAKKLADKVGTIAKDIAKNRPAVEKQFAELSQKRFAIDGMAKLKFQHGATQASMNYETPKLTKEQVANPTPDFTEKLLELRNKPLGSTVVLNDTAKAKFYVAVSTGITEKTAEQFAEVFRKTNAVGAGQNPLFSNHALREARQKEAQDPILRLRAEAKFTENEEFAKKSKSNEEE